MLKKNGCVLEPLCSPLVAPTTPSAFGASIVFLRHFAGNWIYVAYARHDSIKRTNPQSCLTLASSQTAFGTGKEKNLLPVSTAEYKPCGWRSWLNNTTITFGINNLTDEQPPFVAAAFENGYDESTANIKGRTWYVALKKRF